MKTALIYDEKSPDGQGPWVEAEYESPETVRALLEAIGAHCQEAVGVPFGPRLLEDLRELRPDLAFNIAEGREGPQRESIVPAMLDYLGIPYTGSDGVTLGVSLNKAMTKRLALRVGVPTPPFWLFESGEQAREAADGLDYPLLAKPNYGGSSVGIGAASVVCEPEGLAGLVDQMVRTYRQPCLVEGYVRGADVTVGLLGNGRVQVLPAGAIRTAQGMYSAEVKRHHDREVVCPCELPDGLEEQLADWSLRIYRVLGARDFARVDYMLDEGERPHFLEINPLPGLSPCYGVFPVLAEAAGCSHTTLIGEIMRLAIQRNHDSRSPTDVRLAGTASRRSRNL
jgi:D-alanine--D-alanine ligase